MERSSRCGGCFRNILEEDPGPAWRLSKVLVESGLKTLHIIGVIHIEPARETINAGYKPSCKWLPSPMSLQVGRKHSSVITKLKPKVP